MQRTNKVRTTTMWSRKDDPYFGDFKHMFWSIDQLPKPLRHKFVKVRITIEEVK